MALFLVLYFSYYTLIASPDDVICGILLSMLMVVLFILSVIRHLFSGDNVNCPLNWNSIYKTLWTRVRSGLLISVLGKLSWFRSTSLITMVLLM